jgi:hypothetical protein
MPSPFELLVMMTFHLRSSKPLDSFEPVVVASLKTLCRTDSKTQSVAEANGLFSSLVAFERRKLMLEKI